MGGPIQAHVPEGLFGRAFAAARSWIMFALTNYFAVRPAEGAVLAPHDRWKGFALRHLIMVDQVEDSRVKDSNVGD